MKSSVLLLLTFLHLNVFGQSDPNDLVKPIVEEGKRLYKSEMASWNGTDIFVENYKNMENVGGYFSYTENDHSKCIFFSNALQPKVIGTIVFDSTYNTKTAIIDLTERNFTTMEEDLFIIRKSALEIINSDTLFKTYKNTNLNLIPLINANEKKVYVLTGPKAHGVVIFGNDYLISFDKDNKLINKKQLHRNIIPIYYGEEEAKTGKVETTTHSHLPETGDFITATDICTLMLYEKFAKWPQHIVISEKYFNMWNCVTDELVVVLTSTIKKIQEDVEKRNKKKDKGK